MNAEQFVKKYWSYAVISQHTTNVPALVIMAQAALETGWGGTVVGNMMFGVKDKNKGTTGQGQLLLTTEYINNPDAHFPTILSVVMAGPKLWKYKVRDWFRRYDSPEESFTDHAKLLSSSARYAKAMALAQHPYEFATEIAKAGYATDPLYAEKLHSIMKTISRYL